MATLTRRFAASFSVAWRRRRAAVVRALAKGSTTGVQPAPAAESPLTTTTSLWRTATVRRRRRRSPTEPAVEVHPG